MHHLTSDPASVADAALVAATADFQRAYPGYAATAHIDRLRASDYARLDAQGHVYLDYTGGGLYAQSQLDAHMALLRDGVFGNPHSHNPTSMAMTELVERARAYVLRYFNAAPEEYVVIFTPNASGALKLVGEAYPFQPGAQFVLAADNHNSVNGIREFARFRGANVTYVPLVTPDLRLDTARLDAALGLGSAESPRLFSFPAQSNYSGVKHPLTLIDHARARGWDVLLDAAAFVPTNRLDLSRRRPDFVTLSFYKMFGYPTGVGALIARRAALARLQRPWFAGGTIKIASVKANGHALVEGEAGFEDGTVNYLMIPAVEIGLRHLESVGIDAVSERVACLTGWLLDQLVALRHSNGSRAAIIHGPITPVDRGGTIALNLLDPSGVAYPAEQIEHLAAQTQISLRTGCFCNPGCGESAHGIPAEVMRNYFAGSVQPHFQELVSTMRRDYAINISALRVSVGLVSTFADVYRLLAFFRGLLDRPAESLDTHGAPQSTVYSRDVT